MVEYCQKQDFFIMKKFFFAAFAACLAVLATSCQGHLDNQTGDESGLLYGTWVLDTYKIEASGTNNDGNDYTLPVPISYKLKETTLTFGEDLVAWAHMGWETKSAVYSFDNEKQQVTFGKLLEVSVKRDDLIRATYINKSSLGALLNGLKFYKKLHPKEK